MAAYDENDRTMDDDMTSWESLITAGCVQLNELINPQLTQQSRDKKYERVVHTFITFVLLTCIKRVFDCGANIFNRLMVLSHFSLRRLNLKFKQNITI